MKKTPYNIISTKNFIFTSKNREDEMGRIMYNFLREQDVTLISHHSFTKQDWKDLIFCFKNIYQNTDFNITDNGSFFGQYFKIDRYLKDIRENNTYEKNIITFTEVGGKRGFNNFESKKTLNHNYYIFFYNPL